MLDHRIKLRHVETFVEITRRGSLKEAAESLHLTQPAVTRILKELEHTLGVELLTRDRGGIALTPQGAAFLQHALAVLEGMEQAVRSVRGGAQGRIAVGALPSVAARLLPCTLRRFATLAPDTNAQIEDGPHGYLIDRLRNGQLDLVVGRLGLPDSMKGISFTQLYTEHVVIVAAPDHPFAGATQLSMIADEQILYPSENAAIRPLVDRAFIAQGAGLPRRRFESVSESLGRAMVREGDTLWIISNGVVAADIDAGRLVKLPLSMDLTAGPVGVMARSDEETGAEVRLFRQAILGAVADLNLV